MNEKELKTSREKIRSDKTRTTNAEHALLNQQNVLFLYVSFVAAAAAASQACYTRLYAVRIDMCVCLDWYVCLYNRLRI